MPQLAACFALVRPVSMNDEAAAEWLAVAVNELAGYELPRLRQGFAAARRQCTHHGQIIPTIFENMRYGWDLGKPLKRNIPRLPEPPGEIQGLIENATNALRAD